MSNTYVAETMEGTARRESTRRRSSMFEVDPNMRRSHGDSIISMLDRSSIMDIKKKKNYQNTYKLEPDEKTPMAEAKQIINVVIKGTCEGMDYEIASQNSTMISSLTNEIQKRLKSLCEKRYRIIAQVFFIENNDQDVHVASKWLWNPSYDDHITVRYVNSTLVVVAAAHFVYLE